MNFFPAFLSSVVTLSSATAIVAQTPNPNQVYIKRITYSGAGCASSTVRGTVTADAKAFTLVFDEFLAEAGPGIPGGRNKASCKLTVDLKYPQGWSYTVFKVDYRGYAGLDSGVWAKQTSKYYFQSHPADFLTFSTDFAGPFDNDYKVGDQLDLSETVWSPCGKQRALNIESDIEVNNDAAPANSGFITVDSIDGNLTHIYGIRWYSCNP